MLFSGIAWTADGYVVDIIDQTGAPHVASRRFGGCDLAAVVTYLHTVQESSGHRLATVVDSTNGVVDGYLLAGGLDVYRADPGALDTRPAFGSVSAHALASLGRRDLTAVTRLRMEDGSLLGRVPELDAEFALAKPIMAELAPSGRCVRHGSRARAEVALTFDDGPNPIYTGQILDVLARYDVTATFFCIGLAATGAEKDVARIADLGHTVGNHTWSHPYLPDLSAAELKMQVDRTSEAVTRVTGVTPTFVRPPYGALTPAVLDRWTGIDESIAMWDVEADDWAMPGADVIADRILERTQPGSVILLHDGGGDRSQTVQALPAIIEGLAGRGLSFTTIPELIRA